MTEVKMPHPGHEEHLCLLQNTGFISTNLEDYKNLVRNPSYVCKNCGRTVFYSKGMPLLEGAFLFCISI
jgi:hypothetical protein